MYYTSTRGCRGAVDSSTAIAQGIASDGGLFSPHEIPTVTIDDLLSYKALSYQEAAKSILSLYLTDYTKEEISESVDKAYNSFESEEVVPVIKLAENLYSAELWHGPTSAFKDVALQLLPHLLIKAVKKNNIKEKILILVATSGDTGKAALEGFKDIEGTRVVVYYPSNGVSDIQYLQMASQEGGNTDVIAVEGNFDDTQTGVKKIFSDFDIVLSILKKGYRFSSANSINLGRLLPQIVYYFTSYVKVMNEKAIRAKEYVDFVVPTGNFGNILAGFYAKRMGLPIGKLICASNTNKILFDFLNTGDYDTNREFQKTISPSMDIAISSNFERLLYATSKGDCEFVTKLQKNLIEKGHYSVSETFLYKIKKSFAGGWANEDETKKSIKKVWDKYNYLIDPHTAVGFAVLDKIGDSGNKRIVLSTANPYKFTSAVLESLTGESNGDGFIDMQELMKITNTIAPESLSKLKHKKILHNTVCKTKKMTKALQNLL